MNKAKIVMWATTLLSWIVLGLLLLFVVAILGGVVFIAGTALKTIFYPIIWLLGKMESKPAAK